MTNVTFAQLEVGIFYALFNTQEYSVFVKSIYLISINCRKKGGIGIPQPITSKVTRILLPVLSL